jgi:putative iron-only hydrogenase system regulator
VTLVDKQVKKTYITYSPLKGDKDMENKDAIIEIIVEKQDSVKSLNVILHEYAQYIIGRMGIPYPQKNINIISIIVDAPNNTIDALSEKISGLDGVSAKAVYSA